MAVAIDLKRRAATTDYRATTSHRVIGLGLASVGVLLVLVTLIANVAASNQLGTNDAAAQETLAWSFGVTTMAFGLIKLGIGVILIGILVRLWLRVDSVKVALSLIKPERAAHTDRSETETTPFGKATVEATEPAPLTIHRMAKTMWAPMLAMGIMAVAAGLIVSIAWAAEPGSASLQAWTQGLQFLGEGFLLGGVAFLLGSILAALRSGGGELQESLGVRVKTLVMPASAKAFIALMAAGLMVSIAQFLLYVSAASAADPASWFSWLGPLREFGLGLILAGIVLALATIGKVLGFQFHRIHQIATTGK